MTDSDNLRSVLFWQRADSRSGGRDSARDYEPEPAGLVLETRSPLRNPPAPEATGRTLKVVGLVMVSAGVAGWLWMILALVSSVGAGTLPDDPFGTRLAGIPLGSGGLFAIVVGGVLAAVGSRLVRTARERAYRSAWRTGRSI